MVCDTPDGELHPMFPATVRKKKDRGETKHWALPSLVSARGEITEIITAIFQLYGRVEFQQLQLNNVYAL